MAALGMAASCEAGGGEGCAPEAGGGSSGADTCGDAAWGGACMAAIGAESALLLPPVRPLASGELEAAAAVLAGRAMPLDGEPADAAAPGDALVIGRRAISA